MRSEKSLADRYGDPYDTFVEPGEYRVFYRGWERGYAYGSERTFCWFTLSADQMGAEKPLIRVYNAITKPFVPRTHNIARDYYAVTKRRAPPKVKPDDFLKGCELLVRVETVNAKDARPGRRGAGGDWGPPYSKIGTILKVTIGSPPCLQKKSRDAS